jgi:hypothetical protein
MGAVVLTLGKLAFATMGVAVGVKLARQVREQGLLGLHTIALAAIFVGGLGLVLLPLGEALASRAIAWLGEAGIRAGMLLLCCFIAETFRPTPVGHAAAAACAVLLVGTVAWDLRAQPALDRYDYALPSSHANQVSIAIPFLWAACESARLWLLGRRRLALGLVDADVVRSYLIWSVATGCFVAICALAIGAGVASAEGADVVAEVAHALRGVLYGVITVGLWLGLFHRGRSGAGAPAPAG